MRTGLLSGVALCLLAVPVAVLAVAVLGAVGGHAAVADARAAARPADAGGRAGARDARREPRRPHALDRLLAARTARSSSTRPGTPSTLPESGSRRAWTAVERDGRRVAAILHDAELDTGPELVQAAAAAAALALDNERLKADLRARVEELRVSRVRIVEAADAARRRLERDLHDGAQQQLVSLALDLRVLKARAAATPEAAALVDELAEKLATGLAELRELARGIHPAVLTQRGLGPAIESLAERIPLPVDVPASTWARSASRRRSRRRRTSW